VFLTMQTLERQRVEMRQMLHEAHVENRWHRQFFSGLLRLKQLLLLWCGHSRTLLRCWLAWGAHIMRKRILREQTNEVHQLIYALRVATLPHAPLSRTSVVEERAEAELFDGYNLRRAWLGWASIVAKKRVAIEYSARAAQLSSELLSERDSIAPTPSGRSSLGKSGRSSLGEPSAREQLRDLHSKCTLHQAWLMWRVNTGVERLREAQENNKHSLLISVWQAAASGVMQSTNTALNPRVSKGLVMRKLLDSSDDDDDDLVQLDD